MGRTGRSGAASAAEFLESAAASYASSGYLSAELRYEATLIDGLGAALDRALAQQWERAQERGWDEELARRGLRRLGAEHAAKLFDRGPLSVVATLGLLGWVVRLPKLPALAATPLAGDNRMLGRVRALLAKAESTEFPEEAEAFTAKAQQLIAAHCLHEALAAAATPGGPGVTRILADDPYAEAKSLLISVVAVANRCRAVWFGQFGFATVVGFAADLHAVEIIHASLLVQATQSMAAVGSAHRAMRSPSFRRSFLLAFASRIGDRLSEAEEVAREAVADDNLLPVLAARDLAVEAAVDDLFPNLEAQTVSITNGRGWAAGRSAADHAELTPFDRVSEARPRNLSDPHVIVIE